MNIEWLPAIAAFGISIALVGLVRQLATKHQILDVPSDRSSHTIPTPRGGGIGLVLALLIVLAATTVDAGESGTLWIALAGVIALMIIGWLDDRYHLSIALRLTVHVCAAILLVPLARALAPAEVPWILIWQLAWTLFAIGTINLVNFMDGVDGLVASQGVVIGTYLAFSSVGIARLFAATLALSCFGFLYWNWAPARVFLGDAGSGPLGLLLVIALLLAVDGQVPRLLPLALPFLPLMADAAVTLALRVWRRERFTTPHRMHLYQRVANGGAGHAPVSAGYAAMTALACAVGFTWEFLEIELRTLSLVIYVAILVTVALALGRKYPLGAVSRAPSSA